MDYKQMAVIRERKLASENERLKELLKKALELLEQTNNLDNLGITEKEYKKIMGE